MGIRAAWAVAQPPARQSVSGFNLSAQLPSNSLALYPFETI